jgi:predicted AAA+ superfamily ATPase
MIKRKASRALKQAAKSFPVIVINGPRQSGKTTLSKHLFKDRAYVSLESPDMREQFNSDPRGFLKRYKDGAVFDEVQKVPSLFSYLQEVVDSSNKMGRFVLTGSSQFELIAGITQSLAGRTATLHLMPFSYRELQQDGAHADHLGELTPLLFKGLYPPVWDRNPKPALWYANYIHDYLERDVRSLLNVSDLNTFQRFLRLCAARCGQLLNLSEIGTAAGVSHNTIKSWISILEASYVIFLLKPFYNNFNKRLVKTPKIYFYDTGLLCWLLSIQNADQLDLHPMRGAVFESFVVSEKMKRLYNQLEEPNLYFWRDRGGAEIDLITDHGLDQTPTEIKSGQTFQTHFLKNIVKWKKISGSTRRPEIIYGGEESFKHLDCKVVSWKDV